jgi:hypothetical protein
LPGSCWFLRLSQPYIHEYVHLYIWICPLTNVCL